MTHSSKNTGLLVIRSTYVISQFATVFCQFFGSIVSLWDYYDKDRAYKIEKYVLEYATAGVISTAAALIFAYTTNEFQGVKINEGAHLHDESSTIIHAYPYKDAPRNWKSNLAEAAYLLFASILTLTNNYFTIAGIKAYGAAFFDPKHVEAIAQLGIIGFAIVALKTGLGDLPFNLSNASYEAAEEIKEKITASKAGPLISLLMKPCANKLGLFWICTIGTFVHTLWDFTGLFLCVPPQVFIKLYKIPLLFWTIIASATLGIIPVFAVNVIQTRYFEGKESEINLKAIMPKNQDPLLNPKKESKSMLHHILTCAPWLKTPIKWGFYTQAPMHAFSDTMPVILLLRHLLSDMSTGPKFGIIAPLALLVFIFSTVGSQYSEVKTSIRHYERDFCSIN